MTALAKDKNVRTRADSGVRMRTGLIAASVIIYHGALVARNAAGNLVPAANTAGLKVVGVAQGKYDNTGGAAGALEVKYLTCLDVELVNGGGAIGLANKLGPCFVTDDQTVTTAAVATNNVFAGQVIDYTTTSVWVFVDESIQGVIDAESIATLADSTVSPAVTVGGQKIVFPVLLPDAATADYDFITRDRIEITDVLVIKDGAGAANTLTVKTGAGTAISDAIAAAVDKAVTRAGTLDKATRVIAAGGTIRLTNTRAAGTSALYAEIHAIKRAGA